MIRKQGIILTYGIVVGNHLRRSSMLRFKMKTEMLRLKS
nr:MAG TPA: hypothetical protein [Caudoviricetes sp.]